MELLDLKTVKFTKVLLEYGVEVLVAIGEDSDGLKYLASAVLDKKYNNPYLVVQLSEIMANKVCKGAADILSAFLTPAKQEWYILDAIDSWDSGTLQLIATDPTKIPLEFLPGSELYLKEYENG